MACYHPLKAFYRVLPDGKKDIKFAQYKDQNFLSDEKGNLYGSKIDIPCGQCVGCRLEYSRQWAVRCVLESLQYEHNYFLTLTYSPESLTKYCTNKNVNYDVGTGEVFEEFYSYTLVPEHLTKFLKDLRRYFSYHYNCDGIRFFACGEYGEKFFRPHFHIILFNCNIPDLEFIKNSFNGDRYYSSKIIEKIWSKGFVCIGDCNFNTCSYTARYMMKKQKGENSKFYSLNGLVPPFCRSSRCPGIARTYYDENSDNIYTYDQIVITNSKGIAKKVRPPIYFDRLYDIDSPLRLKEIKEKRKVASEFSKRSKLSQTDLDYDTFLSVQEDIYLSKSKKLLRPIE